MKKEEVYINLQGKTKEELTDLWEFLTSNGEKPYRDLESFLEYSKENFEPIGFSFREFCGLGRDGHKNKTEVTIQQLKEILQPMEKFDLMGYSVLVDDEEQAKTLQDYAFKQGIFWSGKAKKYNWLNIKSFQFGVAGYRNITVSVNNKHYEGRGITKKAHFHDIFKPTIEQQLQKAEAEVKRLKEIIEDSKIKIGDWVKRTYNGIELFKADDTHDYRYINSEKRVYQKITNPELIKLIEDETNENNLFR